MNHTKIQNISRTGFLWIINAFLITCTAAFAQTQPRTEPNEQKIDFNSAQIQDINQLLDSLTGKKIIPSQEAENLLIAFYPPQILPKSKVIQLIYKYLKEYGFIVEETNDAIYIKPNITKAKTDIPLITDDVKLSELDKNLVVRKVFQLKHIRPSEICPILEPLLSNSGYLSIEEIAWTLQVIDKVSVLLNIEKQIGILDSENREISPDPMVTFIISDIGIDGIIQMLTTWTGKQVILPREVMNLRTTIPAPEIVRRSQAIYLLYETIRNQGFFIEETDEIIYIKTANLINRIEPRLLGPDEPLENIQDKDAIVRKVFNLKHIKPSEMRQILESLIGSQGYISANDETKSMLIFEKVETLKRLESIILKTDVPYASFNQGGFFEIRDIDPNEIAPIIKMILKQQIDANSPSSVRTIGRTGSRSTKQVDSNSPDPMVAVSLSGMKIEQIVQILQEWTGKKVVASQETQNLIIDVYSPERMRRKQAINLLYLAIKNQGFTAEETEDTIYIKYQPFIPQPHWIHLLDPNDSLDNVEDKSTIVRKIFKLNNYSSLEMGKQLLPLLSPSVTITADTSTNTLMITDTVKNLLQIEQMIKIFDSDPNSRPKGGVIYPAIPDDPVIDVNFTNAGIHQIIEILIRWTGKAVLPSNEALGLNITLSSPEKIRQSEALNLLYYAIRNQGFIVENRNNILYINPSSKPLYHQILGPNDSLDDAIVQKKYNMKNYNSTEMGKQLLPLLSPSGHITADKTTSSLIITDTMKNLKQCEEIIKIFDSNILSESSELSAVSDKDPNEIVKLIKQILNQQADAAQRENNSDPNEIAKITNTELKQQGDFKSGSHKKLILPLAQNIVERIKIFFIGKKGTDYETISVMYVDINEVTASIGIIMDDWDVDITRNISIQPLVKSRQLLVFGKKQYRDIVRKLVSKIDVPNNQLQRKTFRLQYAKPEDVKAGLDELFDSPASPRTIRAKISIETFSPSSELAYFMNYAPLGVLVVLAPEETLKEIEQLIKEWDSPVFFQEQKQTERNERE